MLKRNTFGIIAVIAFFQLVIFGSLSGENVKLPGNPTLISRYIKFYYNLPTKDFIYHLNDLLIFSEAPTKSLIKNGIREKLLNIILMEKKIDQLIKKRFQYEKNMFTINISKRKGLRNGIKLLNYLGLYLENNNKKYDVEADNSSGIVDYHRFINLNIDSLETQINKTKRIFYNHLVSTVPVDIDFDFLKKVSGLYITPENFLINMVRDKRFSILLGIIFRLSDEEINYISGLKSKKIRNPWKTIYEDKKFLMGMFTLSDSLRVKNGSLLIPGGKGAAEFWSVLAKANADTEKFRFLKNIATGENGKLNYLFSISFWQPLAKTRALFFNLDPVKMRKILDLIKLTKNEKLAENRFPRIRKQRYFNLLFSLEERNGDIYFPGDIKNWINIFGNRKLNKKILNEKDNNELFYLFVRNLIRENSGKKEFPAVRRFISIYSKFVNRPELLNKEILNLFYSGYSRYNILIDYVDKIDLKNRKTVTDLFNWIKTLQSKDKKTRADFSAIYQSCFEILSFVTKNHPNGFDFDKMVNELISIPINRSTFITNLFHWFNKNFNIPLKTNYIDNRFQEFLLQGLNNRIINVEDVDYEFRIKNITGESINRILESQEVIRLSTIFKFEKLFRQLNSNNKDIRKKAFSDVIKLFQALPHPEISDEAPGFIKRRVMTYTRRGLNSDLGKLGSKLKKFKDRKDLTGILNRLRKKYIFPHMKNFLVTIAYAINAKTDRLRMFINPNLVKLHDFEAKEKHTPWNYAGRPESSLSLKSIPGFRLTGGLSRLNLLFASVWKDQMLAGNIIYDSDLVKSLFSDIFELFPYRKIRYFPEYISLLIDLGLESMEKAAPGGLQAKILEENIRENISGNSYRKISQYLKGKGQKPLLFYSQYYKIGKSLLTCKSCIDSFSQSSRLKKFMQFPLKAEVASEKDHFGNIYFHCLGSLRPKWKILFPHSIGNLFRSGYYLGEPFNEFKMRLSYLSVKKKYPAALYGHCLYNYLITAFPRFYQQNYDKDIFTTYFIFDIMNNSLIKRMLKKYKRKGYVRII